MFEPAPVAFVPPQFGIKLAAEAWESEAARALRRQVFCREQKLFSESDRDPIDAVAQTIVAVDYLMGMAHRVVGTVRIHADSPGTWWGSRLAIDLPYRAVFGLGSGLVQRAVTTAHARGCTEFFAHVQTRNVGFFRRLAWEPLREVTLFGHPHVLMQADLAAYPANADDAAISYVRSRRAS